MPESIRDQFIAKLEAHYGPWEKETSRFGTATFGRITKDLCISASQFSKLIYGNGTEGMYLRSIRNIDRLIAEQRAVSDREAALDRVRRLQARWHRVRLRAIGYSLFALLLGGGLAYWATRTFSPPANAAFDFDRHPLLPYFEQQFGADYDSPYLKEAEVQDYCPCSGYEGQWVLNGEYKLPLPGSRKPGVYYLAKSADVRMKCSKSDTLNVGKGRVMIAFEHLVNEVWVDTEQTPLSPKYFDKENKQYTAEFINLTFTDNPQFRKVATIHSFFIDKFEIYPDSIVRQGEPVGRIATEVDDDLAARYEIDMRHTLRNVLGNLTKTDCRAAPNPACDPNELSAGESIIAFDCLYTIKTENLGIGGGYPYRKGYRLREQSYSDNLTCTCPEPR